MALRYSITHGFKIFYLSINTDDVKFSYGLAKGNECFRVVSVYVLSKSNLATIHLFTYLHIFPKQHQHSNNSYTINGSWEYRLEIHINVLT